MTYVINNIFNLRRLRHNQAMASKYALQTSSIGPIGAKDLPSTSSKPWLDEADALKVMKSASEWMDFTPDEQRELANYVENGFMVLKGWYSEDEVKDHNAIIDELLSKKSIDFNYSGSKLMDVHELDARVDKDFFRNQRLLKLLRFIFDKEVLPFQTIHFVRGSQQRAHSDSIHMSTYPPGYLLAAWTALENIGIDQGPVFYYPGSHRWPYVSCEDYESGNTKWTIGANSYKNYEDYIDALIKKSGIQPEYFTAEAGDVLVWHANLIHGGSAIHREGATRRSMVAHYYADDVFCYHEISQRPALIKQ